ncbi:helix-turn-helix domain-containing protein [Paenibacillus camelliae]|uniref:helix-turn-helix domain-containing protein n=1 Tax=Paenibacillus camelliae TaxID=512410 RepID=UPI002040BDCF|nr:helix-turn-helix transcriptional regulator [Paenibacillus camelliae]MCM3632902.1 helix-turn-helix domain-containing protein [Paenibacillus camelliae]
MNFGEELQSLRKKYGLSISALSGITGVHKSTISYIERSTTNPSIVTAQILLEPLGAELAIVEKKSSES